MELAIFYLRFVDRGSDLGNAGDWYGGDGGGQNYDLSFESLYALIFRRASPRCAFASVFVAAAFATGDVGGVWIRVTDASHMDRGPCVLCFQVLGECFFAAAAGGGDSRTREELERRPELIGDSKPDGVNVDVHRRRPVHSAVEE